MALQYFAFASITLFVLGPLLAHLRVLPPFGGFVLLLFSGVLGLVTVIWAAIALLRGSESASFVHLLLGVVPALAVIAIGVSSSRYPRLNSFNTETGHPFYPGVKPLTVASSPDDTFARAAQTAQSMPSWTLTKTDPSSRVIEGYSESFLFRFRDDFAIRVEPASGGSGAILQMRSASRDGQNDFGQNAKRIEAFMTAFQSSR